MKSLIFLTIILYLSTVSVFSQLEGNPANWCRNGFFPREEANFYIGKVKAKKGERVYFYGDDEKCPIGKTCQKKAYLINGNEVLVSRKFNDFSCVWYQPKKGAETVGWVLTDKIDGMNFLSEKYNPWSGEWKFYNNSLKIERIGATDNFKVAGNALWKGFGDNIHVGEIESEGTLNESIIKLKQDDCEIKLNLVVHYLIVSDNFKCGGANVTFSGVYRKK